MNLKTQVQKIMDELPPDPMMYCMVRRGEGD